MKQKSMDKKKVLWISPYAPYDTVAHAGGKNLNYYLKYLHKSGKFDIMLLSLCLKSEEEHLDLDQYGIRNHIYVMDRTPLQKFRRLAVSAWSVKNPYDKYAGICPAFEYGRLRELLRGYGKSGIAPDLVILQWTFAAMLAPTIRRLYGNCRIVAVEEDVTFLGYARKLEAAETSWQKIFWRNRSRRMKTLELETLKDVDLVVTTNAKDSELLRKNGINEDKIFTSTPYFDDYSRVKRKASGRDILFYGAMSRPENSASALWFIENVMPLIEDMGVRFVVVGSHPDSTLLKRKSGQISIEGYVEDVSGYFARCLCFAAPLRLGAGIKIKVLEALSSGIPVLTNHIGIEGIAAENGKEYIHCETAEEYASAIRKLVKREIDADRLSANARELMERYRPKGRLDELIRRLA